MSKKNDYEKKLGQAAYFSVITKLRMSTGLSFSMLDLIIKQFVEELSDELAISEMVTIPELGTIKAIHRDEKPFLIYLKASKTVYDIYKNRGTDGNKILREQGILPPSALTKMGNKGKKK